MMTINMLSKADSVPGQGVLSAHDEQVNLVKTELSDIATVYENKAKFCDISHFHTINPQYWLIRPFLKCRGKTVGYVHFLPETVKTGLKLPKFAWGPFFWYMLRFYKGMDYLVTVNPYFIGRLAHYGVPKEKVTYIPNFVSDEQFYLREDKVALREKYGLSPDRFTVLCVGQLQHRKGIFDFLEVAKQMPDCQFVWAGDFAFGKIMEGYEEIKKVRDDPPENVKFLGLVDRKDMNEVYNLADVMFLASFEELFPMTILESMNCAVPILLRDLEIYHDILFDFYEKASDVDGFVKKLRQLQQEPEAYKAASEASWRGHMFYSKEHVAAMWRDFYEQVYADLKRSKGKSKR